MSFSWHRFRATLAALQASKVTDHPAGKVAATVTTQRTPTAVIAPTPSSFVPAISTIVAVLPEDPAAIERRETQRIAVNVSRIRIASGLDQPPTDPVVQRIAAHAVGICRPESSRRDA